MPFAFHFLTLLYRYGATVRYSFLFLCLFSCWFLPVLSYLLLALSCQPLLLFHNLCFSFPLLFLIPWFFNSIYLFSFWFLLPLISFASYRLPLSTSPTYSYILLFIFLPCLFVSHCFVQLGDVFLSFFIWFPATSRIIVRYLLPTPLAPPTLPHCYTL